MCLITVTATAAAAAIGGSMFFVLFVLLFMLSLLLVLVTLAVLAPFPFFFRLLHSDCPGLVATLLLFCCRSAYGGGDSKCKYRFVSSEAINGNQHSTSRCITL
jgi:hypothetical protein